MRERKRERRFEFEDNRKRLELGIGMREEAEWFLTSEWTGFCPSLFHFVATAVLFILKKSSRNLPPTISPSSD